MPKSFSKALVFIALPATLILVALRRTPSQSPEPTAHSVYEQHRDWVKNPATIFDEIADPAERQAFRTLTQTADPAARLPQAEAFLRAFPQSWVLAQVYALASNGAMETGLYDRALGYGVASLQILPEDPLLLAPVAELQARAGQPNRSAARRLRSSGAHRRTREKRPPCRAGRTEHRGRLPRSHPAAQLLRLRGGSVPPARAHPALLDRLRCWAIRPCRARWSAPAR